MIYASSNGISMLDIPNQNQKLIEFDSKHQTNLIYHSSPFLVVQNVKNELFILKDFKLCHQQKLTFHVTNLKCLSHGDSLFVLVSSFDAVYLYKFDGDLKLINKFPIASAESICLSPSDSNLLTDLQSDSQTTDQHQDFIIAIGTASGELHLPLQKIQKRFPPQEGAVTDLAICGSHLLVTTLFGPPRFYQLSPFQLLFQTKQFFGQTLCCQLTPNFLFCAGQNKEIAVFDWQNQQIFTLGRDFEQGRGINDLLVFSDYQHSLQNQQKIDTIKDEKICGQISLVVGMEHGECFTLRYNGVWSTVGRISAISAPSRPALALFKDFALLGLGNQIVAVNRQLQQIEVCARPGCEVYCLEPLNELCFLQGGDENLVRVVQTPLRFLQSLYGEDEEIIVNNCFIEAEDREKMTQALKDGTYPLYGVINPLDPSITPIYAGSVPPKSEQIQFQPNLHPFPQTGQMVGVGGAKCMKIAVNGEKVLTLGASGRLDEEQVVLFQQGVIVQKHMGLFKDVCWFDDRCVLVGLDFMLIGDERIQIKAQCACSSSDHLFVAVDNEILVFDASLKQVGSYTKQSKVKSMEFHNQSLGFCCEKSFGVEGAVEIDRPMEVCKMWGEQLVSVDKFGGLFVW